MYSKLPYFVLGFHGTDKSVCENIISGKKTLTATNNDYDWLGHGIYFWENDPYRAFEYATFLKNNPSRSRKKIEEPAVIGAIIDLGNCLNLIDHKSLEILKAAYDNYIEYSKTTKYPIPEQKPLTNESDVLKRPLDCAVIEMLHQDLASLKKPEYDSVRGVFWEGSELYPNAGFRSKNHIQICVRTSNCIKGYFHPRKFSI